ncbi:MAG: hypothetical protein WBB01_24710 [Phormidesmis sp.]
MQIDSWQLGFDQFTSQLNAGKFSLSSSISSEQFFGVHNSWFSITAETDIDIKGGALPTVYLMNDFGSS